MPQKDITSRIIHPASPKSTELIMVFKTYRKKGLPVLSVSLKERKRIKESEDMPETEKKYRLEGYHVRYLARGVESERPYVIAEATLKRAWDAKKYLVKMGEKIDEDGSVKQLYGLTKIPEELVNSDDIAWEFPLQ